MCDQGENVKYFFYMSDIEENERNGSLRNIKILKNDYFNAKNNF